MASYQHWTQEDDRRLLDMRAAGKSYSVIAKELKRTQASVLGRTRAHKQHMTGAEGEPITVATEFLSAPCPRCGLERDLVTVQRVAEAYALRSFRCPSCRSVLRLVGPRDKHSDRDDRLRIDALRRAHGSVALHVRAGLKAKEK
jgi:hypothetical protein